MITGLRAYTSVMSTADFEVSAETQQFLRDLDRAAKAVIDRVKYFLVSENLYFKKKSDWSVIVLVFSSFSFLVL